MALNLRQKQIECILRMLDLNQSPNSGGGEEMYKILIYDRFCQDILSPLIHVKDLRKHGVTLFFLINKDRKPVADVPAVYFLQPTPQNVKLVISDAANGLYNSLHLNFSSSIPRPLLEDLASGTVNSDSIHLISKVHDQYMEFVTLEDDLFTLANKECYLQLNDPSAGDKEIDDIIDGIVNGLFCVFATLCVVPVIRCPSGGPAEMVALRLNQKLQDHLLSKNNLFSEGGKHSSSFNLQRPVLCLFDRNFDLSVAIQHDFRYRPLVHDVLGLKLNKVDVQTEQGGKKSYELDRLDSFWVAHGYDEFPALASANDTQITSYKEAVEKVSRKTAGTGELDFEGNTNHLIDAVKNLPELTERKNSIDKHTTIATALLGDIKERSLDSYANKEKEMMSRGGIDRNELMAVLKGKGSKNDKLRFAIMYLICTEKVSQSEAEMVETALRESEIDTSAFQYVKRIKSLNVSLASANSSSASGLDSMGMGWAERLYGQSISVVAAGVKNVLGSSDHQMALVKAVEALMEGRPNPEIDTYLDLDPKARGSSSHQKGPFKEAIVFMIGGGNYVEYGSLRGLGKREQSPRHIMYGTTELLTGAEFVEQLSALGHKMGLGSGAAPQPN